VFVLTKSKAASPIAHATQVKAASLVMLGLKDLRVPVSQGKLWHDVLTRRGLKTRLMVSLLCHSLGS
jgi:acylaminoacyl-peptidase